VARRLRRWGWRVLVALDQLANTLAGGHPDETISSRLGRRLEAGQAGPATRALCAALDRIDPQHCLDAIEEEFRQP